MKNKTNTNDLELQADAFLAMYDTVDSTPIQSEADREKDIIRRTRADNEFSLYARKYGGSFSDNDSANIRDPEVDRMIRRAMSDRVKADKAAKKAERFELMREANARIKKRGVITKGNAAEAEERILTLLGLNRQLNGCQGVLT